MNLCIRAATPDDVGGIVVVFNPIITAGPFTTFTEPYLIEAEHAYILSMTNRLMITHLPNCWLAKAGTLG